MRVATWAVLAMFPFIGAGPMESFLTAESLAVISNEARDARAMIDVKQVRSAVHMTLRLSQEIRIRENVFHRPDDEALTAEERRDVLALFSSVIDYVAGLDAIARFHEGFFHIDLVDDPLRHARHFSIALSARLVALQVAWDFIDAAQGSHQLEALLDEPSPAHGLSKGSFARLKWATVHAVDVTRVLAAFQYRKFLGTFLDGRVDNDPAMRFALTTADALRPRIEETLKRRGVPLFAGNGIDILVDGVHRAVFPVQKGVAEWLGDTRVKRAHTSLISAQQIDNATRKLLPGDVLFERRNWYLSNIGLPGFWPHAALFVGTVDDASLLFDDDDDVTSLFGKPFTLAMRERHPEAFAKWESRDDHGDAMRIIEAMSEGVVFTSTRHSLACDYAGALRPRRENRVKAQAIDRALATVGRPYDFDFDFFTDSALVCSEVVFKAYEPVGDSQGIVFPLENVVGRMTLSPNTMVRMFDESFAAPTRDFDFVFFLDGKEASQDARANDEESFRRSWQRPKWDIAQK